MIGRSRVGQRSPAGFTLIELMIVIALIALLAAILVPSFQRARGQAVLGACDENLRSLAGVVAMYQVDNHGLLPNENSPGSSWYIYTMSQFTRYLPNMPRCPLERVRTSSYTYSVYESASGQPYWRVYCGTCLHKEMGCPDYFPRYHVNFPGFQNGLSNRP